MNAYELKQEMRRERLQRAAERAGRASDQAYGVARQIWDSIPFGQPILVGHHSERRHRRALEKADNAMRRSCEEADRAKELAARAEAVGSAGISGDDPDAPDKIRARIAELEAKQARMTAANRLYRKGDAAGLLLLGLDLAKLREEIPKRYSWERSGPFVGYQLSNNSANIRRLKQRLTQLERVADAPESEVELAGGVRLAQCPGENRTRLYFPGKPEQAVRKSLKSCGYRWSPTVGAWQRHYDPHASSAYRALGYSYDSNAGAWRLP